MGSNVTETSPGTVVLGGPAGSLENLALAAGAYFTLRLRFSPYPDSLQVKRRMPDVYRFDVSETSLAGEFVGGQRATLKTYVAAGNIQQIPLIR